MIIGSSSGLMKPLITVVIVFLGMVLLEMEANAQGGNNGAKFDIHYLSEKDLEYICTLSSTGEDVFYYLKASHSIGKYKLAEKTADFRATYFREDDAPHGQTR